MYEQHFGLKKRPFRANAQGTDVFVGPQSATAIAAIKKALNTEEAVVSVSGPAGVGKTTVGKRALDGVGKARIVVTVGRMKLGNDEVLELLLAGLGTRQLPKSTVHRFALFRRQLQRYAEQNKRVIVVVEDAVRAGTGTLSELEALTAADAGVSEGANIVLMADSGIAELLREPALARLKQRVRLRQTIQSLNQGELLGYLKHSFRLAGGDFDSIFAAGAAEKLYSLSDGIPRIVNNLVEAALTSAAENQQQQVSVALIDRIAKDEFGLTGEHSVEEIQEFAAAAEAPSPVVEAAPEVQAPAPVVEAAPEIVETPAPVVEAAPEIVDTPAPLVEAAPEIVDTPAPLVEAAPEVVEEPQVVVEAPEAAEEDDIPELIQDTLPDLAILSPDLMKPLEANEPDDLPTLYDSSRIEKPVASAPIDDVDEAIADLPDEPVAEETEDIDKNEATATELTVLEQPVAEPTVDEAQTEQPAAAADEEIPEWERDPTLAQLRPDLDALDRAMAVAQGTAPAPGELAKSDDKTGAAGAEEDVPKIVPEITLDREIQAKIEEATEALKQTHFDIEVDEEQLAPESTNKPAVAKADGDANDDAGSSDTGLDAAEEQFENSFGKNTQEIKDIASGIARAKTIEDVDDQLAETLFGAEFSAIAADVVAKASRELPANDEMELELDNEPEAESAAPTIKPEASAAVSAQPKPEPSDPHGNIDNSPSQRLATLREINAMAPPPGAPPTPEPAESIVMASDPAPVMPPDGEEHPDSIEDQINTSMTQTLKALSLRPENMPDDDEDEEKKGGFFSRFRRS